MKIRMKKRWNYAIFLTNAIHFPIAIQMMASKKHSSHQKQVPKKLQVCNANLAIFWIRRCIYGFPAMPYIGIEKVTSYRLFIQSCRLNVEIRNWKLSISIPSPIIDLYEVPAIIAEFKQYRWPCAICPLVLGQSSV